MTALATETPHESSPPPTGDAPATRRCIVTGESAPRGGLIRFVVSPSGEVVPDLAEKLPGRGLWVAAERETLAKADARAFARAAKAQVTVPADLAARVESALARAGRRLHWHGAARGRAGRGLREGARSAARGQGPAAAGRDRRCRGRARQAARPDAGSRRNRGADRGELGAAIGREAAVHAVVTDDKLAREIAREACRLAGVRGERPGMHADDLLARVEKA